MIDSCTKAYKFNNILLRPTRAAVWRGVGEVLWRPANVWVRAGIGLYTILLLLILCGVWRSQEGVGWR